jgi:hypothetical protein
MPFDGSELPAVTQHLIAGRRNIEAGWVQNFTRTRNGVCVIGALGNYYNRAVDLLLAAVAQVDPEAFRTRNITAFNDRPGRTKQEVLEAFDRAVILSLEAKT